MYKVRSWILLLSLVMTVPGMSMQEKYCCFCVSLPFQQHPVACATIIVKTLNSNILAHTSNYTNNFPRILAVSLLFSMSQRPGQRFFLAVFCPCLLMLLQLQTSSLILLWCWYHSENTEICRFRYLKREINLHFILMVSQLAAIVWRMNHGCSFWWQADVHSHIFLVSLSVSEHALAPGWPVMLAHESSISEWVHRHEVV